MTNVRAVTVVSGKSKSEVERRGLKSKREMSGLKVVRQRVERVKSGRAERVKS